MIEVFFFQAEDGIRDYDVTGVQTCALPIWINELQEDLGETSIGPKLPIWDENIFSSL